MTKIHAIQTGTVRVKESQRVGRGRGPMRQVNILLDGSWSEPLPILAWAIETANGVIVVDTGETAGTKETGYFPRWHPYFRLAVRFDVEPEQEIGPQLLAVGISPLDVRTVIMTHLHTDHAGGLGHFPRAEILVSKEELTLASGFAGRLRGYLSDRWPDWFAPTSIGFDSPPFENFGPCQRITPDGNVIVVATPGHTPGHVSVIVLDEEIDYFLAGDTTYAQQSLLDELVDGVSPSESVSLATLRMILKYAQSHRTVYLPSHDPDSVARLKSKEIVPGKGEAGSRK
jgi:N-acyl homoserine lactone hydrolase